MTKSPVWQENYRKSPGRFQKGVPSWIKGRKHPNNSKCIETLRNYIKEQGPWNKGTKGFMKRNSGTFTSERVRGPNNHRWKGGISDENSRIRKSPEYKAWRMDVFQRDRFACVKCGYRSCKPRDIRADHVKPFSLYPELRFDVGNGRTLCLPCDLKHGWNSLRESNADINYAHNRRRFYRLRIGIRLALHQVLTPPRQETGSV